MPSYIIISYFILWPIIMISSSYIFFLFPREWFRPNSFLFKQKNWELGGKIYEKVFFAKKWKKFLPDGAAVFKGGFRKKNMASSSKEYISDFILESCRAEISHILPIFLSFLFALYNPPHIVAIMFVFALIVNLPCIIVQRYNRIRFSKLLKRYKTDS